MKKLNDQLKRLRKEAAYIRGSQGGILNARHQLPHLERQIKHLDERLRAQRKLKDQHIQRRNAAIWIK